MKPIHWLLLLLGLAQMTGELVRVPAIKGIGAATTASPAPKVFSSVKGLETFSTEFFVDWTDRQGHSQRVPLTAELYQKLGGPYNRRNVYGAALAYGPFLPEPWVGAILRHVFCESGDFYRIMDLDPQTVAGPVRILLQPKHPERAAGLKLDFEVVCP